jgi:N-acetylglutamate synthase-like GNAT family acetyltransferase
MIEADMDSYQMRRATTDDVEQLSALWHSAHLPAAELEKQFTDFQVAEGPQGKLFGAIAMQIEGNQGRIHSEAFTDFGLTDELRPRLWQRLQAVAQNHGLFRLWTEETAPYWKKDAGFTAPAEDVLQKLPAAFRTPAPNWLTLRLRDEGADMDELDKALAMFKEAERAKLETLMRRGRALRAFGTVVAVILFLIGIIMLYTVARHRR